MNDPLLVLRAALAPEKAPLPALAAALYALRRSSEAAARLALALHDRLHPPPVPSSCSGCQASHAAGSVLLLLSAAEAVPHDLGNRLQEAESVFAACRSDYLLPTSVPVLARAAAVLALNGRCHEAALVSLTLHDTRTGHNPMECESCLDVVAWKGKDSRR
jgi:hypothetical protein